MGETEVLSQTLVHIPEIGNITVSDLFHMLGYLTTILILSVPISGCQRHDPIGAISYAAFIVIAANILIFAIPDLSMSNRLVEQIIVYLGFGYAAIIRWDRTFFEYLLTKERVKIRVNTNGRAKTEKTRAK